MYNGNGRGDWRGDGRGDGSGECVGTVAEGMDFEFNIDNSYRICSVKSKYFIHPSQGNSVELLKAQFKKKHNYKRMSNLSHS